MGIILSNEPTHKYLEKYGFEKTKKNCIGSCENCYERAISIHDGLYYLWVAIDTQNRKIHYYAEYECGGEVKTGIEDIPEDIKIEDEDGFMTWLDENATEFAELI